MIVDQRFGILSRNFSPPSFVAHAVNLSSEGKTGSGFTSMGEEQEATSNAGKVLEDIDLDCKVSQKSKRWHELTC